MFLFSFFVEHSEGDIVIPWVCLRCFMLMFAQNSVLWKKKAAIKHVTESPSHLAQPHRFQLVADVDDADGYAGPADGHGVPWVELGNCRQSAQSHPMRSIGCALIPTDTIIHYFYF